MIKAPEEQVEPKPVFYHPHRGVIRESSSTTKLRVVFNRSCRVLTGLPLNEILHTGAKHQTNLFDVLLWFSRHKYVFSADVKKMYRQIKVHPNHWNFQRIMLMEDQHLVQYQLTTITYHLACAPFLVLRTMLQLVHDEGNKFLLAVDALTKGCYVDDVFEGATTIDEAQQMASQVNQLCMAGGFSLKKWIRNHPKILELLPPAHRVTTPSIQIKNKIVHTLGLSWNSSSDNLHFDLSPSTAATVTKRVVLSKIAQFIDPLGLLSPLLIQFTIFVQELSTIKIDWDHPLASPQSQSCQRLLQTFDGLDTLRIPRWVGTGANGETELHGFCDASQLAMASSGNLRTRSSNNHVAVSLLCSKSKVASLKRLTIPRLELAAAVMLTKLVNHCLKVLNLQEIPCYLWKRLIHCFLLALPYPQWKHNSGKTNPADYVTRGLTAVELQMHPTWWTGPSWLAEESPNWPTLIPRHNGIPSELEQRPRLTSKILHISVQPTGRDLLSHYSTLKQLLRITAICQKIMQLLL